MLSIKEILSESAEHEFEKNFAELRQIKERIFRLHSWLRQYDEVSANQLKLSKEQLDIIESMIFQRYTAGDYGKRQKTEKDPDFA